MPRGQFDTSGNPKPKPDPKPPVKPKSARPAATRVANSDAGTVERRDAPGVAGYSDMARERDIEKGKGRGRDVRDIGSDGETVLVERLEGLSVGGGGGGGGGERRKGKEKEGGVEGEKEDGSGV